MEAELLEDYCIDGITALKAGDLFEVVTYNSKYVFIKVLEHTEMIERKKVKIAEVDNGKTKRLNKRKSYDFA